MGGTEESCNCFCCPLFHLGYLSEGKAQVQRNSLPLIADGHSALEKSGIKRSWSMRILTVKVT